MLRLLPVLLIAGCLRGNPSERPPVHLIPDMDNQQKYMPLEESDFFEDGAAMRPLVPGTVARGELRDDSALYTGKDVHGAFIETIPVPVTLQLLERGRERYDIFCSVCHSRVGDGRGILVTRGYVPPADFHTDRLRELPVGEIFNVITHGIRNMPAYNHQVPVSDRWAVIAYIRALQRSQNATIDDVPADMRQSIR